jgi:CBS domain-containing protein
MNKRKFAGLIDARLLINQLPADAIIPYERIFKEVLGINKLFVFEDVSTLDVLKKMEKDNVDKIAVVNKDQSLRFIANRDVIVSKLITSIITQENDKHPQQ